MARLRAPASLVLVGLATTACGAGGAGGSGRLSEPTRIEFSVESASLHAEDRLTLAVTATFTDGTREDVTGDCKFASGNDDVKLVDGDAAIEAVKPGDTKVTASYRGLDAALPVHVKGFTTVKTLIDVSLDNGGGVDGFPWAREGGAATVVYDDNSDFSGGHPLMRSYSPSSGWGKPAPGAFVASGFGHIAGDAALVVGGFEKILAVTLDDTATQQHGVQTVTTGAKYDFPEMCVSSSGETGFALIASTKSYGLFSVQWTAAAGFAKTVQTIDADAETFESYGCAVDDKGHELVVYGTGVGQGAVVTAIRHAGAWSRTTLRALLTNEHHACEAVSLNADGEGLVSFDVELGQIQQGNWVQTGTQRYVAEVGGGQLGAATPIDPAPIATFDCGGLVTLTTGDTILGRTLGYQHFQYEILRYQPGKGVVDASKTAVPGMIYSEMHRAADDTTWVFGELSGAHLGDQGDWLAVRMDPKGVWHTPIPFIDQRAAGTQVDIAPDGTLAVLGEDDYTLYASVYH